MPGLETNDLVGDVNLSEEDAILPFLFLSRLKCRPTLDRKKRLAGPKRRLGPGIVEMSMEVNCRLLAKKAGNHLPLLWKEPFERVVTQNEPDIA